MSRRAVACPCRLGKLGCVPTMTGRWQFLCWCRKATLDECAQRRLEEFQSEHPNDPLGKLQARVLGHLAGTT